MGQSAQYFLVKCGIFTCAGGRFLSAFSDETSGAFILDGMADTRADLLTFRQALEATDRFSRVHFPLSILEKEENVRFTVTLIGKKET